MNVCGNHSADPLTPSLLIAAASLEHPHWRTSVVTSRRRV